ncbi:MAG: saccharopine dehydrogenase NADP-binding domain-containing protein [Kiritimatiellaeota bacterium]|nr:saccharopine dehydrogenase NADP-binding domain-containing protein [Kiritimatiellota bacterium]
MTGNKRRVLMVGYGFVARCALPLLVQRAKIPCRQITVLDFEDRRDVLKPWLARGVRFVRRRVTRENLGALLGRHLSAGDLLVDLAWNIDCCEILQWCHAQGVLYINTSIELWDPYAGAARKHPTEKTLYWRQMQIRRLTARWREPGPTAVLEHGANPGLISHWTKRGLTDIARRLLADGKVRGRAAEEIRETLRMRVFNRLAMQLGVKVIHCSERDTQVSDRPKAVDEFVNTWSIEGFREEGITTAELGWGTHERELPALACAHPAGPQNQICLARMGMNTRVRTWVPHYDIQGMVVRHGEAFTISDRLTVWRNGKAVYRPTVHYAYCPCDAAISSLHELRGRNYELQPKLRIMTDEITGGDDILGAFLMGHAYNGWWTGSQLSIAESRRLVLWMLDQPDQGVLEPDDLPHDAILAIADPYLGHNLSLPVDWTPLRRQQRPFGKYNAPDSDRQDPWQFKNFLIQD